MKVHVMTGAQPLREFQRQAVRAAEVGFSGLVVTEAGRTAYLSCAAAALTGADLDLATGVAVAFPRSPMVTASNAWELAEVSGGRFRLGIGPQVRAHVERRYSAAFDPPGPRMKEYVLALRAIFKAFRGDAPLDFTGEYYQHTLLTPIWSPGPIAVPDPPVDIAAVNPWMLRMAGEVCDGVHVHPMNTPTYLAETVVPNLTAGAERAGRDPGELAVFLPLFTAVGDTEEERAGRREASRTMTAFYGSTPNYAFIFDQVGHPGTTDRLRAAQKAGDMAGMSAIIDDDLLSHFVVEGTWDELPDLIVERCKVVSGFQVNVVLYLAGQASREKGDAFERFGRLARRTVAAAGS